ncbi:MAG: glycosyltransferase [Acidobacteria bacterium]|nr:glycosyltransferase [Acidobacteriota bacterium]
MTARWTGAENDYRGILGLEMSRDCKVAVVIPAFERPDVLSRSLAGLLGLGDVGVNEVVVVDDGSTADLESVVSLYSDVLPIRFIRQEFDGFGAGRARNLGAQQTESDVILFLDADCIPARGIVERHLRWHNRVSNAVVVGSRVDIDETEWTTERLRSGGIAPDQVGQTTDPWGGISVSDWRASFYRGTRRLLIADGAFRACVSNNLSVSRSAFDAVGGFSDAFTAWGGEDTELGWRLFQDGNFVVPEEGAVVFHQVHGEDQDAGADRRATSRNLNRALMADLIPNRMYRSHPGSTFTVPQLTWIVSGATPEEIESTLRWINAVGWLDNDIVVVGSDAAVAPWLTRSAASGRFAVRSVDGSPQLADLLPDVRGEFVALVGPFDAADKSLLGRTMKRFDADPRLALVQVPYVDDKSSTIRRVGDLLAFDQAQGFPMFCVVRRRALAKHPRQITVVDAVAAVSGTERSGLISNPKVRVEGDLSGGSPSLGIESARRLGPKELARMAKAKVDRSRVEGAESKPSPELLGVSYVGFTGKDNLGDEAILQAIQGLLPGLTIERDHPAPAAIMVGGGTILNGNNYYLTRMMREDRPGILRFVFAPGVRDPDYWGVTEPMEDWFSFFRSAEPLTVRGPDSARHLRTLGWKGDIVMIGDPALSLARPEVAESADRVIVAPLHTGGNLHGGDDSAVLAALAQEIDRLTADGLQVTLMASFPGDDRWILEIERLISGGPVEYMAGYADRDAALTLIAQARLVIGERLHASILAAAMHTPFVALEYRPKVLDFARSIDCEQYVVRTDAIDHLSQTVDLALRDESAFRSHLAEEVARLIEMQRSHAEMIAKAMAAS